ncbi:MAG: glutamate 5-kinase [Candidatus Margulisiibacteriota bacterium]|jgi:glutamate 5-kinase
MLVVIKIGSNILTTPGNDLDLNNLRNLCDQIAGLRRKGMQVVVVTSGAIVCGSERLGIKASSIPEKQAAAAVGQSLLVNEYNNFLEPHKITVAQVLLTKDGVTEGARKKNVQNTLKTIIKLGAVPIINENDTVSTDEIRFGDNDMLSAIVAKLVGADRLVILTDIDGLHTANPRTHKDTKLIANVPKVTKEIEGLACGKGSGKAVGGMITKIAAAKIATKAGIETVIANGRASDVLLRLLVKQEKLGTKFQSK